MLCIFLFRGGNVVFVSSVAGYQPMQVSDSYIILKHWYGISFFISYISVIILTYLYLSKVLNAGLIVEYFLLVILITLVKGCVLPPLMSREVEHANVY